MSSRSLVAAFAVVVFLLCWAPPFVAAAPITMGSTGCFYYDNEPGKQGSKVTGVQCAFTSSLDGSGADNNPIPLVTGAGLLADLNDWLSSNGKGVGIGQSSFVGIEAIGGQGRNGNSCSTCDSGKGAGGGYAVTVQTLGGMQQVVQEFGGYVDQNTPPLLFIFVGDEGKKADTDRGGGGGAASFVTGMHPAQAITQSEVLFPSAQTNGSENTAGTDDLFFVIAGGGGGGGGARNGSGKHGGDGGRMITFGPKTSFYATVSGEDGTGGNGGEGGSSAGDGIGGHGNGGGNNGASGVGGQGGMGAGFIGSTFAWPYGLGGPIGGDQGVGGAGGGGWGGGGGAGESDGAGHGGGGGGSWARQSVSTATFLPMLFNLLGHDFSLSDVGFSQVVLSFSVEDELDDPDPVPEPSSLAMVIVGLAGLVVAIGRSRRNGFFSAASGSSTDRFISSPM